MANKLNKMKKNYYNLLIQLIPPIILNLLKSFKSILKEQKSSIIIQGEGITVPIDFPLETYQYTYKEYDRFLPILVQHINQNGIIIDIGANVGDTLFSILKNCQNEIKCIEPSDIYFKFLEENYQRLSQSDSNRVELVKKYIGTGSFSGNLVHEHGTAHIEINNNGVEFIELDKLFIKREINLIKVDTDGFDYDVLLSSKQIISNQKPILFWENLIEHDFQLEGFNKLYSFLSDIGYDIVYLFDNFGNIITYTNSFDALIGINDYLFSQLKFNSPRTFYYTDVLAATQESSIAIENAIKEFKQNIIFKK